MARNNPKPAEKPDWIPDDTSNIVAPSAGRKTSGWLYIVKPPAQNFNWLWNLLSRFTDYFSAQVEDWIVIDSDADEGDYATLAAYLADAPAAGDRVLIKEDQTVTAQTIIPSDITIKPLDGARVLCATNIASSVLQLNDNAIIEGILNIVLSHTGTTAKAVEYNGDNATGKINVENSSTGTLTTAHHVNANKTGNQVSGFVDNSGAGSITNDVIDNSAINTNDLKIRSNANAEIIDLNLNLKTAIIRAQSGQEQSNAKNINLLDVESNGSLFVAVGQPDGVDAYILTSPDGTVWTERANPKNFALNGITWGNSLFVAVGAADGADAYLITSPDGITWTERTNPKNFDLNDVVWDGSLFVAVGNADGTDAYIVTSPDGITWTERTNPKNFVLYGIDVSGGLLVAVGGFDGTDAYIVTSPDGTTWTERANPSVQLLERVAHNSVLFASVGDTGTIVTSPDGITWTLRTSPVTSNLDDIIHDGYIFVSGGISGGYIFSKDGINWNQWILPITGLLGLAYGQSRIVAVGGADGVDADISASIYI